MREIKFRGFHKFGGISGWVFGNAFIDEFGYYITQPHTSYNVEENSFGQFTGLKDDNGIAIYEGDIVEDISGVRLLVEWNDDTCQFQFSDGSPINDGERYASHKVVVGNIYESPELLNKEQGR